MTKINKLMTILILIILSSSLYAQGNEQKLKLHQYTPEQNWERTVYNLTHFILGGIKYAKLKGETAEDYGKYLGEVHAEFWNKDKGTPAYLVSGITRNFQMLKNFKIEILKESDKSISGRMNRAWDSWVKDAEPEEYGISVDEFNRFFEEKWKAIATYLGLVYNQRIEGDWIYFTVKENE